MVALAGQLPIGDPHDPATVMGPVISIEPTIFTGLDNTEEVIRPEIFGPVVGVLRFSDEEEAVTIGNDTDYGLAAYLETADLKRPAASRPPSTRARSGSTVSSTCPSEPRLAG